MPAKHAVLPPIPIPTAESAGYWQAASEGRFAIQRCASCRRWFHPPQVICTQCGSERLAFEPVSGRGSVYGYSVMYDKRVRGFEQRVPYIAVWVELDEQPLLIAVGNLLDTAPGEVRVGLEVEVCFEKLNERVTLLQFRRRAGAAR
jgi:uncharacterized protein